MRIANERATQYKGIYETLPWFFLGCCVSWQHMNPKRIMAFDVGTRTVGIAMTDPLGIIIQPLTTLRYPGPHALTPLFDSLKKILEEYEPKTVVIGLPLNMNGSEGTQSKKVRSWVSVLKNFLKNKGHDPGQYHWAFCDERLSTDEAKAFCKEQQLKRKQRAIDEIAAIAILTRYQEEGEYVE